MNGFCNLLKPPGMTSFDAVAYIRRRCPKGVKVGHMGTLDPDAAGVLPIGVGKATRLFPYVMEKTKAYLAELCVGVETDTLDASGTPLRTLPPATEAALRAVLPGFVGTIWQTPPAYSALHIEGRRLYELAREGKTADIPARQVEVHSLRWLGASSENRYLLEVECGPGVYIRSLAADIAKATGSCGHLSMLLRTRAGVFDLAQSLTLEALDDPATWALLPLDAPLGHLPAVHAPEAFLPRALCGNPYPFADALAHLAQSEHAEGLTAGAPCRLYVGERFAGIAAREGEALRFRAMLL